MNNYQISTKTKTSKENSNYILFENEDVINDTITTRKIKSNSDKIKISHIQNVEITSNNTKQSSDHSSVKARISPKNNELINNKCIITETFNKHFIGKTIKSLQYDIVKSIMDKKDTVGILPTGYGKSVCYQLPYLLDKSKIVIVVSPLISLMEDQKDKLEKLNIPVACFHSNVGKKKKQEIKEETLEHLLQNESDDSGMVIFLTPEYLIKSESWIKQLASHNRLSLFAFDEAHCISTWGHDFRPDYQGLTCAKEWVGEYNVPLLALTATATKQVEDEIKLYLQLDNPNVFKTSFDRPNLIISVKSKPKEISEIFPILDTHKDDFSIIYCKTRDKAESMCQVLKENEYNADVYHAGLSADTRKTIQDNFANKKLNIIVATIAFGMGIDQNIHLVIHWGCPCDMESYYQEIGRAGRDGIESDCILYHDKDDFKVSRYFLRSINDTSLKKYKDEQIAKMERYCLLPQCRRKTILKHFGENLLNSNGCGKCDNCYKQTQLNILVSDNLMYPMYIIANTIFTVKCKLGIGKIVLITRGSKSKLISEFNKYKTYGLFAKDLTDDEIKSIISIMVLNGYLKEKTISSGFGTVLETTSLLVSWYTKVNRQINGPLTYDNLYQILLSRENILNLNIPTEYKNITKIKFKSTIDEFKDAFGDDF